MKTNNFAILVCLLLVFMSGNLLAYDDKNVHPEINENAAYQSSIDLVVKSQMGFADGIETQFSIGSKEKRVWQWLRQGGTDEDDGARPRFHFHNPLEGWESAGIAEPWTVGLTGSALLRAQSDSNEYSWSSAREHFYQALTTTTGAEESYAETFRALGALMHLVSDMAVPAHVRLDPHLIGKYIPDFIEDPDPYEHWTADEHNSDVLNYVGVRIDLSVFSRANPDSPGLHGVRS